ncbi:MAG: SPOR domain-containing protein, partial [Pseudomonadota bacterium]
QSQFQIQLGAYPERSTIELEWSRLSQANNDVLSGRALAVQQTVSGGTTYYRLRVGPFRDGLEASTVCQALKARGYDCLVAINTESRG